MLQRFEIELCPYRNLSFLDPDRMDKSLQSAAINYLFFGSFNPSWIREQYLPPPDNERSPKR
jgi:hypothetical protein